MDKEVIACLKKIIKDVKNGNLSEKDLKKIINFFNDFYCEDASHNLTRSITQRCIQDEIVFSKKDIMKYITLGWYMYKIMENDCIK